MIPAGEKEKLEFDLVHHRHRNHELIITQLLRERERERKREKIQFLSIKGQQNPGVSSAYGITVLGEDKFVTLRKQC